MFGVHRWLIAEELLQLRVNTMFRNVGDYLLQMKQQLHVPQEFSLNE